MRVLAVVACFILFLDLSDCWARRRRLQSGKKKREVSRVNGAGEVKVSLEQCEADIQACGFTVQCSCCNKPSFLGCGATGLIGSPSIQLLRTEKRDISDIGRDEAGCHLRSVLYDEKKICIPGNVASMFVIADQSSAGDCYPVFPLNCKNGLAESTVYYQYIYVPRDAVQVQRTLSALLAAGHFCQISEDETQGGIKCAI
ncbi:hypothetical protein ACHWQZ_G002079 [Mnemiopsis leidyi]